MAKAKSRHVTKFHAELRRYRLATPFVPFDVILKTGERILINEPTRLAFNPDYLVWADRKKGITLYRKKQVAGFEPHENAPE